MTGSERRPRADAARNAAKIVEATRYVFGESGSHAPLEEVAQRAGVGIATLYRHFPTREHLVRATLEHCFTTDVAPTINRALHDDRALPALVRVIETTLAMISRERNVLAAAKSSGAISADLVAQFLDPVSRLLRRGQTDGDIRGDVELADLLRLVVILVDGVTTVCAEGTNVRRCTVLVLDCLRPHGATPLPSADGQSAVTLSS